jgi:rhomboid protease GluP
MPTLLPKVTYTLIGITAFIYALQLLSVALWGYASSSSAIDWLEAYGARFNEAIQAGQIWRFITPAFLHASPPHIFFNMYALFSIGSFLEKQYGHWRFLLLYLLGAFAGNVFSFLLTGANGFSVGASTAVFGLISAELIFFYQNRELFGSFAKRAMGNAIFFIALNLFISLTPGIDLWGHVGGMLGGAIFAWFSSPRWTVVNSFEGLKLEDERGFRETITAASIVVIIFGLLAGWGMFK